MTTTDTNPPRAYDLDDPEEYQRLYRECRGYIATCRMMGHGTDLKGRDFAIEALEQLIRANTTEDAR